MTFELLDAFDARPHDGEVVDGELAVTDDVLIKAFALGPGAAIEPYDHPDAANVFHVVRGSVTVVRDGDEEAVSAPGVVLNERGTEHGARNEGDDGAVLTASLCPLPQ